MRHVVMGLFCLALTAISACSDGTGGTGTPTPFDDTPPSETTPIPVATPTPPPSSTATPRTSPTPWSTETPVPPTPTSAPGQDRDNDGFQTAGGSTAVDCNDADPAIYPGAVETCDKVDNDCDGAVDEANSDGSALPGSPTWYIDVDGDGHGSTRFTEVSCTQPQGYVANSDDCDDSNAAVQPGATESCNSADDDCDGSIDENNADGSPASGAKTWYIDYDSDGYGSPKYSKIACNAPSGYVADNHDCDDADSDVHPGATELCNGIDDNCDGSIDGSDAADRATWYRDQDYDGFGVSTTTTLSCNAPDGYAAVSGDCFDGDPTIYPGATELCDGVDDDCDGEIDEDSAKGAPTWYRDVDGDGFGDALATTLSCDQPSGYVAKPGDCDDTRGTVYPGAEEKCDGLDNDCDGVVDDSASDALTWYKDSDSDTYGDEASSTRACTQPAGTVSRAGDCNDSSAKVYPGADETCDGLDNDCNGKIDDDPSDGTALALDADKDGYGAPGSTAIRCGGVSNELDCDDADSTEPQIVDAKAAGTGADGSDKNPWTTIQDGINQAEKCVLVRAGTYTESIDFKGKALKVTGIAGPASTTISATGKGKAAVNFTTAETAASELSGFLISGGEGNLTVTSTSTSCGSSSTCTTYYYTYCGGGIYIKDATPTLHDLLVTQNSLPPASTKTIGNDTYYMYSYGGGICVTDSTVSMVHVDLRGNSADQGGGLYVNDGSTVTYQQAQVVGNLAADGGGFEVDGGSLTLVNVLSSWNKASASGGGVYAATSATLKETNVTHGEDDASSGGVVHLSGGSKATIMNTIVYGANTGTGIMVDASTLTPTYNNVYGNKAGNYYGVTNPTGSNGNISADPLFSSVTDDSNPGNDIWTLKTGSPSINAGNPSSSYNDADGTVNDQGAFGGPQSKWNG